MKCHQKIRNDEVMAGIGVTWDVVQNIMEKKLNLFSHILRMADDREIMLVFGIMERSAEEDG